MSDNLTIIHHSLNRGEVSPRIAARQDRQEFYMACCLTMQNAIPLVAGGAYWRPGTQYVGTKKTVADHPEIRLIDFVASRDAAYVLEFGHQYVRFYRDGAALFAGSGINSNTATKRFSMLGFGMPWEEPLPIPDGLIASEDRFQLLGLYGLNSVGEVASPYADSDLEDIITVQSVDVMYLFHKDYPVHKITRISETEFTLTEVNFNPPATLEEEPSGEDLGGGTLTPAAVTGPGVDFTAANSVWLGTGTDSPHVGQIIVSGASRAQIVSITSATVAVADIIDDFVDTSPIAADEWRLVGSPNALLDVTNKRTTRGQIITITARNLADSAGLDTFRASDVDKYIALFGGMVKINTFTDAQHVKATILVELRDIDVDNPEPTPAWTMEVPAWSTELGYPSAGCFFQGRLYALKGLTVNGSVTGDFENFGKGSGADDAIARTIDDDDVDAGVWIKGDQTLKVATGSGIYQCSPTTTGGALTPSSFKVEPIDPNGGTRIAPIRVMPVLLYVDASRRGLRQLAYDFGSDKFKSPNVFQFAEHLVDGFFLRQTAYAKDPQSIVYLVRSDGVLFGLVFDAQESVVAWFRVVTDGKIKSVAVIPRPSTGKDWVWIAVERENGIFIEHFEPDHADTGREWSDLQTDSAIVTTHDANFVVSGLDRFEGQTVLVIGDGMLFNIERNALGRIVSTAVVEDGQITLDPQIEVSRVEVGLGYEGRIVPVEPAIPAEIGGPMIQHAYVEVGIVIRRALGMTLRAYRVNMTEPGDDTLVGEQLVYRKPYHEMDAQVPLQQGKKCVSILGYDPFARIEVGRSLPFPGEILNVHGKLHFGDRWDCETYNDSEPDALDNDEPEPEPDNPCDCPSPGAYAEIQYDGGNSVGGVAVHVLEGSTPASYTAVLAFYIPAAANPGGVDVVALFVLNAQPLGDATLVWDSREFTMTAGQRLQLQQGSADPGDYIVMVENQIVLGPGEGIGNDFPTMGDNPCKEFVTTTFADAIPIIS